MKPAAKSSVLALAALLAQCLSGQTNAPTGTIRGSVQDSTGGYVARARITATNQGTQARRGVDSGSDGHFSASNLPSGEYTLLVEAPGFAPLRVGPFALSVGQVIEQRVTVSLAGVTERLEVKEQPEAIEAAASTASVALGGERIEEAPARSRNYLNFVLAAPGVAPSTGAVSQRTMTGVRSPNGDSGFTFGGMRARNNAILIDGMDNRDETTGGSRVAVGLEMVQEFRVAGTAVGAELGGAAGGLLNMVTRSGVNIWHGDATFFGQTEALNANKPEAHIAARPRFRRYQPGVSAMGPLRRDRTFIAAAVEHERESAEEWSGVPADAVVLINTALKSPAFANAAVPSVLRGLYDTSTRGTEFSAKLNHQPGAQSLNRSNDSFNVRYAFSRGRVRGEVQGPDNFADASAQGGSLTTDHSMVGNWLRVVTPSVINDVRVQIGSRSMILTPNARGAMLEIPGAAALGEYFRLNADRTERHFQIVDQLNFSVGRHRLSTGVDAHLITFDGALRNRFAGVFSFATAADFAAARPSIFVQAFGNPQTQMNTLPVGAWLQDRWEPRPGLHIELGLRFDNQRMPDGLPRSSANWSPRVGIAWRPSRGSPTVFRASAGLFYDRYPLAFLNDAVQKNGINGFEQFATGQDAVRAFALSRAGTLTAPLAGFPRSAYRASSDFPSSHSQKISAGVEHGLDANTSLALEVSYIRGLHLPRIRSTAPNYLLEQTARSEFTGGTLTLNRRLHDNLAFLAAYNFGRTRDDASDFDEHPLDPLNLRRDWAYSRQHQSRRLALSGLFEVPMDDLPGVPGWIKEFFNDLSFAPIYTIGSGRPINALLTTDAFGTGAFPISARPLGVERNPYRMRGVASLDLRAMKTLHVLNDRALLQFGIESFNLSNHANTERVSQYFAIATSGERLESYGSSLESLPARQVQFLIQLEF